MRQHNLSLLLLPLLGSLILFRLQQILFSPPSPDVLSDAHSPCLLPACINPSRCGIQQRQHMEMLTLAQLEKSRDQVRRSSALHCFRVIMATSLNCLLALQMIRYWHCCKVTQPNRCALP